MTGHRTGTDPLRPLRRPGWARAAAACATLFAALHVFWALGGSFGLAGSAGRELAEQRPVWFVLGGLWGVAALLLVAAALGMALARTEPQPRLAVVVLGAAVGLLLLLRGLVIEALLLSGALDGNTAITADQRRWSLLLWNPWFLVGGAFFALAALAAYQRRR